MLTWILLCLTVPGFVMWLWIYLSPAQRGSLAHTLTAEEPVDDEKDAKAPAAARPDDALPFVTIICPGRDEAEHIRTTLPELCEQDYPHYRVIYVDDDSDDETPTITAELSAKYPHLVVVRNEENPPAGWVGKCWAVYQGYQRAKELAESSASDGGGRPGDFVCFTDADIHWHPKCLRLAVNHLLDHDGDVMGLLPRFTFGFVGERFALTTLALGLHVLFPIEKAMDPKCPNTLTGGAFILTRRSLYDRVGGHEAVKSCVVEDLNLGRILKGAGGKVRIAMTPDLLLCRMYEDWSDMWEGLTKNAYAGMEYRFHWFIGAVVGVVLMNILPPIFLGAAVVLLLAGGGWLAGAAAAMAAVTNYCHIRAMNVVRSRMHLPWPYALGVPVGSALYLVFIVASVWRYYRGGNVWKGRSYDATVGRNLPTRESMAHGGTTSQSAAGPAGDGP